MAPETVIAADVLVAHFECRTKARLVISSEKPTDDDLVSDLINVQAPIARSALERATGVNFVEQTDLRCSKPRPGLFDFRLARMSLVEIDAAISKAARSGRRGDVSPVYFSPLHRPLKWHSIILHFTSLALLNITGLLPKIGFIVFGDGSRIATVKFSNAGSNFSAIQDAVNSLLTREQAPAINRHCVVCQFRTTCRSTAIDNDDLRLITSLSEKERNKMAARGVTTIAQLSLTYRPRRKPREHATPRPNVPIEVTKHDPRLRALAIQKRQSHAILPEPIATAGTPVYLDVEGIPGDETYYLLGMRHQQGKSWIEKSFWADSSQQEEQVWRDFLRQLSRVRNPQLIHYGSYENTYISRMQQRYPSTINDFPELAAAISATTNIVKSIYGKIYFPTHTNGLKDIAGHLGFHWSESGMSGEASNVMRLHWQITNDRRLKERLIVYNIEDCRAAEVVVGAINRISNGQPYSTENSIAVDVESLKVPFSRTFGPFVGASQDFHVINKAAYWNYQREKVYVRSPGHAAGRRHVLQRKAKRWPPRPDKVICTDKFRPARCPRCRRQQLQKAGRQDQTTINIIFSKRGARRQVLRTRIQRYRCVNCREEFGAPKQKSRITANVRAYVVYLMMELRLSNTKIAEHLQEIYGISITSSMVHAIKSDMADKLAPIYRRIIARLRDSPVVYVDETKGVVYGGGHYVWVFASSDSTAFVYAPGRSAEVLTQTLGKYRGVLVSDFYGAYEAMECKQQKCLIHLMRDINEAMIRAPFNQELGKIGSDFGALLRSIVETIDRRGLKARFLRRHKQDVKRFFASIEARAMSSEAARSLKKRLVKAREQLFIFLEHDGVSWNNNNAEHALRAFTRLRNSMATSTAKGTQEYAILLSIQQTLKYRGMNFLKFLTAGSSEWDKLR